MVKKRKKPISKFLKTRLRTSDKVIVITGKDKGKTGEIRQINRKKQLVLVNGVNIVKKHEKPKSTNESGKIVEKEGFIHISNVMLLDPKSSKPTRIRYQLDEHNRKVGRIAVKSGEIIK